MSDQSEKATSGRFSGPLSDEEIKDCIEHSGMVGLEGAVQRVNFVIDEHIASIYADLFGEGDKDRDKLELIIRNCIYERIKH